MAVRVLAYITLLYEDLIRSKRLTSLGKLPPVVPIVLYQAAAGAAHLGQGDVGHGGRGREEDVANLLGPRRLVVSRRHRGTSLHPGGDLTPGPAIPPLAWMPSPGFA